jgi:TIR domain
VIFISHSRQDQTVAAEVESALHERGAETWADFSRIPIGERFVEEIAGALGKSSTFVLVSSVDSARSYWVSREVGYATRLRTCGILGSLVQLNLDGTTSPEVRFDRSFSRVADVVDHLISASQGAGREEERLDPHLVDISYYHQRPAPRVWLGFSAELAALDGWFLGAGTGLWVSGLGGPESPPSPRCGSLPSA